MGPMAADDSKIFIQKPLPDEWEEGFVLTEDYLPEDPNAPNGPFNLKFLTFAGILIASIIDGLYCSVSALRFACGVDTESFNTVSGQNNKFNNLTQHWGNHIGLLIAFLVLIPVTILLSVFGTKGLDLHNTAEKVWLYVRAAFSALKNTRTAVISTAFIAQAFAHSTHFYTWANPIGLGLGVLCMANAIWFRRMDSAREDWIKKNQDTTKNINKIENLKILKMMIESRPVAAKHSGAEQARNYASAFADGLTDGIYIYASLFLLLGLSTMVFPPALLIAAVVTVSIITLVSVVSKLNMERKRAATLELSAVNVDIAYLEKKQSLNANGLTPAENEELTSLKEKQEKLNETVNSDNKSFLASAGRQTIMGFKNLAAAGAVLLMIPGVNAIVGLPVFIITKVLGLAYACYLAIPEILKYINSRKKESSEPVKEEEQALASIQAAEPPSERKLDLQKESVEVEKPSIMKSIRYTLWSPKSTAPKPRDDNQTTKPKTDFYAKVEDYASSLKDALPFSSVSPIPCL